MALTKVTGGTISTTSDYQINNIVGVAGTFTTLNVSGVLTYEDVTNIESVGVATFKDDVYFNGTGAGISSAFWDKSANTLKFKDNVKAAFGDAGELNIWAAGGASYIRESGGSGQLVIQGSNLILESTGGTDYLYGIDGGTTALCFGGNSKIQTTGYGVTVFATTETQKLNVTGISTHNEDVTFTTANTKNILFDKSDNALKFGDNVLAYYGDDNDLVMHHTGATGYIKNTTGTLYVQDDSSVIIGKVTGSHTGMKFIGGGALELYHNNNLRLTTTNDGATVTPNLTSNSVLSSYGGIQTKLGFISGGSEGFVGTISDHSLFIKTNDTNRIKIANNSAATAIGTNAGFNGMLTVRGDISGQLLHLKATEDTSRLMVSGTDSNGCEVNLYDGAGGQKGILGVSSGEFFIKAPNNGAPMGFYTHNGSSIGLRLKINAAGDILLGTDQATIGCNTSDGSDNRSFSLCGGSDASQNRGAIITIYGNEGNDGHSQYGSLYLRSGNTTTGIIGLWTQGNERLRIDSNGHMSLGGAATPSSTNGGVGLKFGIKSGANNILIGETTSSSHNGLILESRLTGRSGGARTSQINIGQDGTGGHIVFSTAAGSADVTQRLKITRDGCVFASNFGIGTDSNWKIRANTSNTELAFEYSTSSSLADTNIKAFLNPSGRLLIKSVPAAAGGTMGDYGIMFQASSTPTHGQVIQGITFNPHDTSVGRARAGIAALANNNGGSHPQSGADLAFMTRYSADGHDLDVTADQRLRIDVNGDFIFNTPTLSGMTLWNMTGNDQRARYQFWQQTGSYRGAAFHEDRGDANGMDIILSKSRGGAGAGAINAGDWIGRLMWAGADGTRCVNAGYIGVLAETGTTIASDRIPSRMIFGTHEDAASGLKTRMEITSRGVLRQFTESGTYYPIASSKDGSTSARAATSAWEIKKTLGPAANTGYYYLKNPHDNTSNQWWCDMKTDGGGWILVAHHSAGTLASDPGHWYNRDHKGGFRQDEGATTKKGGGYWQTWGDLLGEIMIEVRIHGIYEWHHGVDSDDSLFSGPCSKVGIHWGRGTNLPAPGTGNGSYGNLPSSRALRNWCWEIENAPGFNPGNYSPGVQQTIINGNNNFTEHFLFTWSMRGTSGPYDQAESGPYWQIGSHHDGLHQHYEESASGDSFGDGRYQIHSGHDTTWTSDNHNIDGMRALGKLSSNGIINYWMR